MHFVIDQIDIEGYTVISQKESHFINYHALGKIFCCVLTNISLIRYLFFAVLHTSGSVSLYKLVIIQFYLILLSRSFFNFLALTICYFD